MADISTLTVGGTTYNVKAKTMEGIYTGNGGQQGPSYFGKNKVGALMSNATINSDSHYKNWLYMDSYSGTDVGGATAIGLDRTEARAFIMQSDANRTAWNNSAELYSTAHKPTYTDVGAAAASHTHSYAGSASAGGPASYLTYQAGNELNFKGGSPADVWFNYKVADTGAATTSPTNIAYRFANYSNDTSKTTIYAGHFSGNAATATKLATARTISLTGSVTGSGSFDGSGNLSIATTTNHTHSYLPLSGGTLTDTVTFNKASDIGLIKNTYGSSTYNLIRNHNNGNISISASSVGLYLGYENTTLIDFISGKASLDSSGNFNTKGTIKQNGTAVSLNGHSHAWSEITGKPSSFTPASHTHNYITRGPWWSSSDTTKNADDLTDGVVFAYSGKHNSATTGTLLAVSSTSNTYQLQIQGAYSGNTLHFRNKNGDNSTWGAWKTISTTDHTHNYAGSSSAGGDANNALKLNGYASDTAASNNTIARRTANGYLFATYLNQSSGAETPTTSSYIMYANSDGYLRKSSLANIKSILGLGSAAYTASTAYAAASHGHGANTTTVAAASVSGTKLVLTNTTVATSVKNS